MKRHHNRALGPELRRRRIAMKITQPVIAQALGYSSSQFVSQWEHGKCEVPPGKLPAISEILDIPLKNLVKKGIDSYAKEYKEEVTRCQLNKKQRQAIQRLKAQQLKAQRQTQATTGKRQRPS